MFCKYRHIFGVEGKGVHKYRFMNIAIVDLGLTLLIGVIISMVFNVNVIGVWIVLILLGILVHRLFCVNTTLNRLIFGNVPSY
jgi:hypothetical protein